MPGRLCRSFVLLFAVLFLTTSLLGQVDSTATIVGWNLKGLTAIPDSRLPALARVIADLDPEVIALAEVNPDDVVDKLILELHKLGACYQGKIIHQTGIQNLAILYKTGIAVSNVELLAGSDDNNSGLRKALTADVRVGQFDFKLIALHLKSGRGSAERQTRSRPALVVSHFIQLAMGGAEKDVLVLGDYNMIPGQDEQNFADMNPAGFVRFVSSEELVGQFSHIGSGGTPGNLLDSYAISATQTREYIEKSLRIVRADQVMGRTLAQFDAEVSDHLPMVARFRVFVDDD